MSSSSRPTKSSARNHDADDSQHKAEEPPTTTQDSSSSEEEEEEMLGTEEQHIRHLEETGQLGQVVGSQSILSQELAALDYHQQGISCSQQSESGVVSWTRRDLLTQDDDEEYEKEEAPPAKTSTPTKESKEWSRSKAAAPAVAAAAVAPKLKEEEDGSTIAADRKDPDRKRRKKAAAKESQQQPPPQDDMAEQPPTAQPGPRKRNALKKKQDLEEANRLAQRAASLASQVIESPEVAKQLLLQMALRRENPRTLPDEYPPRGSLIQKSFKWGHYPPLEHILRSHMKEYYELSTTKCQSKDQQEFNNRLVDLVQRTATEHGWSFLHMDFDDPKKIRDRVRCFFKTHIQNAKKRLHTMLENPTKRANAKALAQHYELIEKYNQRNDKTSDKKKEKQKKRPKRSSSNKNEEEDGGNAPALYATPPKRYNNKRPKYTDDTNNNVASRSNKKKKDKDQPRRRLSLEDVDPDLRDAAQQVMALGFVRLSQDTQMAL